MATPTSQKQLATRLGVSPMTVSRALRGGDGISDKLRARILDAARSSGLPTPPTAKHRATNGLLHVLCTMAPEPSASLDDSPFHGRLLDGLRRGTRECASEIVNCPEVNHDWPLIAVRKQVDGAIMVWGDEHDPKPKQQCPVAAVYIFYGPPHADVVTVDNFGGGFALGTHLAEMGHRRIAFVGPDSRIAIERLAGLRAGLEAGGGTVPPHLALLERGGASGQARLADDLIIASRAASPDQLDFTAVMAYNDFSATLLMKRFSELGIRTPEQLSIVGFDGVVPTSYSGPAITTCAIPLEELGAEAARLVYWRLEHPTAIRRRLALETELMVGKTVARLEA